MIRGFFNLFKYKLLFILVVLILGVFAYRYFDYRNKNIPEAPVTENVNKFTYFGNEVKHDFDNDGREDKAYIVTENTDGSGTFYYVVAELNKESGTVQSEKFFLGDRIAPQTTNMGKGNIIVVNYADRKPEESFATPPSIGKSVWLILDPQTMQFGTVEQNFEGEADPKIMKLDMKTWNLVNITYNDGKIITPKKDGEFNISFKSDKTFSAKTDCNGVGGEYIVKDNLITFDKMMSTLMFCENSQEAEFSKALTNVSSYFFTSKGELVFDLKYDSGSMVWR